MAFIALRCPSCGAEINLDKSREFGFCSYCGTKIMQERQIIEHRGSITLDRSSEINGLLSRARTLTAQGRIIEAGHYYERALTLDPNNIEAQQGLNRAETTITGPNVFITRVGTNCAKGVKMNIPVNGNKLLSLLDNESGQLTLPVGKHELTLNIPLYQKIKLQLR